MNKPRRRKTQTTGPETKAPEKPKVPEAPKSLYGRELVVETSGGAKFKGLCTCERIVNGKEQVFLKLNACVSRWFNKKDVRQ